MINTISSWEEVPLFDSESAEALFWSENRPDARLMESAVSGATETSESVAISLRIDPRMLSRMKRLARSRYLNYQSMMKQWLSERLESEMNQDPQIMKNQNRNRQSGGFTLIELLVVIAIIAILASLITVSSVILVRKARLGRVQTQMRQVESAIESYKIKRGSVPPDNSQNSQTNTLYYELAGTTLDPTNSVYTVLNGADTITNNAAFKTAFNVDGIQNSAVGTGKADDAAVAETFLKLKASEVVEVNAGGVLVKLLNAPADGVDKTIPTINPWHYNSHNPTNNPGGYDLWVEFLVSGKTNIICNWNANVIVK